MLRLTKATTGQKTPIPEGEYPATLRFVDDLGECTKVYDDREKTYTRVRLAFLSDQLDDEGRAYRISQVFPFTLHESSRLMKFLRSWMGGDLDSFIEQEAGLDELVGRRALLTVKHEDREGTTYANIVKIAPLKHE